MLVPNLLYLSLCGRVNTARQEMKHEINSSLPNLTHLSLGEEDAPLAAVRQRELHGGGGRGGVVVRGHGVMVVVHRGRRG